MGFFIKKGLGKGPIKFNLSKSGIGTSFGVKGLRFGIDGKGRAYTSGGKGILRYRKYYGTVENTTYKELNAKDKAGCMGCGLFITLFLCLIPPIGQIILGILIYLLPYLIAELANTKNKNKILWINVLAGFTIIGWFIALFMAIAGIMSKLEISKLEEKLSECSCTDTKDIINYLIKKCPEKEQEYKLFLVEKYKENKMYSEALDVLNYNDLGETRQLKMQILDKLERFDEIIDIIQKDFTPEEKEQHPALYAFLAETFLKMNKIEAALQALSQGPILARKMTDELCAFHYAYGKCYEAMNDKENALKHYNKVYAYNIEFEDVKEKIKKLSQD